MLDFLVLIKDPHLVREALRNGSGQPFSPWWLRLTTYSSAKRKRAKFIIRLTEYCSEVNWIKIPFTAQITNLELGNVSGWFVENPLLKLWWIVFRHETTECKFVHHEGVFQEPLLLRTKGDQDHHHIPGDLMSVSDKYKWREDISIQVISEIQLCIHFPWS